MQQTYCGISFKYDIDSLTVYEQNLFNNLNKRDFDNLENNFIQYISGNSENLTYKLRFLIIEFDVQYSVRYNVYTIIINRISLI